MSEDVNLIDFLDLAIFNAFFSGRTCVFQSGQG